MVMFTQLRTELLRALKDGLIPSKQIDEVWAAAGFANISTRQVNSPGTRGYLVRARVPDDTLSADVLRFLMFGGWYSDVVKWAASQYLKGCTVIPSSTKEHTLDAVKVNRGGRMVLMDQYQGYSKESKAFIAGFNNQPGSMK